MSDQPSVEDLKATFAEVFGGQPSPFGSLALGVQGCSDGHEGTQWNAWLDLRQRQVLVGVNLEGKAYDNWPVARLIERELREPKFFDVLPKVAEPERIELSWTRDCWQAAARVKIQEEQVEPTPVFLSRLTEPKWHQSLLGAQQCLDPQRSFRGRVTQTVTFSTSLRKEERQVSPHLQFRWRLESRRSSDIIGLFRVARVQLQPLHDFVAERSMK